jgi:N-formylglutamate amidohydrolase
MESLSPVLLHIPHSSTLIPSKWQYLFHLNEKDVKQELVTMTDSYTEELFACELANHLTFPVSRLLVDPERFESDVDEPMAARGMGAVYEKTHDGRPLKSTYERQSLIDEYYTPHHQRFNIWVRGMLEKYDSALIVDCHSFPSTPLLCDLDQTPDRPDICIGTVPFHTPASLLTLAQQLFTDHGYSVLVDRPYAGSIVPSDFWQTEPRVHSIMIEVNRKLYMDESTGAKIGNFDLTKNNVHHVLKALVHNAN